MAVSQQPNPSRKGGFPLTPACAEAVAFSYSIDLLTNALNHNCSAAYILRTHAVKAKRAEEFKSLAFNESQACNIAGLASLKW